MTKLIPLAALAAIFAVPTFASAQTTYSCGAGTVRGIEAVDETVTRETIATRRDDDGGVRPFVARADTRHRRSYVLTVQLKDVVYTSESPGDPYGTLDPLKLVAGEPIDICVSANQLIVSRPDGTDYRAPVVRIRAECRAPLSGAPSLSAAPQSCAFSRSRS